MTGLSTPVLETVAVQTGYGDTLIVSDASLRVRRGEIVTIIGPNGAGKSTLLKAIFGILPVKNAPHGKVLFNGLNVTGWTAPQMVRKGAAFVPQTDNVFTSLTIKENMEMGGFVLSTGLETRIKAVLDMFPMLQKRQSEKAGRLSGGQRQALAIARGLMLRPSLIILDEPTAALAPKVADEIFNQIKHISATGVTVLMVEQNAELALGISHRGYVMVDGKMVLEDSAQAVLNNPQAGRMFLGRTD